MPTKRRPERRPSGRPRRGGDPRARLFVALDLPDAARERLVEWRDAALAGRGDLRPVAPAGLHVTLVFIGYRPEREIGAIAGYVAAAAAGLAPARLSAERVAAVPPRRPRLFALDLTDEDGRAGRLQAAVAEALAAARVYEPERRPFWPHLTLARVKRDARAEPLDVEPPRDPFDAALVTLYQSRLSARGAQYEPLARVELR